jgi:hypothetical protein
MARNRSASAPARLVVFACAVATLAGALRLDAAKTDITITYDKMYAFASLHRWAWHPDGPGDIRLAMSAQDDPKRVASRADPVIIPAVERELTGRGLARVEDSPDFYVHYYLLGTIGEMSQVHGQFLPAVPNWGLPPFIASSSALTVYQLGTLVVDVTTAADRTIVWRGAAERKMNFERPDSERRKVVEQAVRDLFKNFPPKK